MRNHFKKVMEKAKLDRVTDQNIRQQCGIQPIGEEIISGESNGIIIYQE
jgi:hypothetical protein